MSETPRTDAFRDDGGSVGFHDCFNFAKSLERELDRLRKAVSDALDAIEEADGGLDGGRGRARAYNTLCEAIKNKEPT